MARLSAQAKVYLVQRLACFDTPTQAAKGLLEDLGETVSVQAAQNYDPTKKQGEGLSANLRKIFEATRKRFIEDTSEISISHRAVRLRALERMAKNAEQKGNMVLAASLMEQAAKECGDVYTNRQKHEMTGDTRIIVENAPESPPDGGK